MNVSGVLLACQPADMASIEGAVNALDWAEVHFTEPVGRMVVTIEAESTRQSMDRLTHIKGIPRVISAEMAEYRLGELTR